MFQVTAMAKTTEVDLFNRLRVTFPDVKLIRNVPGLHPSVTHLVVGDGELNSARVEPE